MTVTTEVTIAQALRRAAVRATLAPSVHNSQPWKFVLTGDALEIRADRVRQLRVLDPTGRQLVISCGCALFNARAALAAAGYAATVERLPDPAHPTLLARLRVDSSISLVDAGELDIATLDAMAELRHTNRRRFTHSVVPADIVDDLVTAAALEGASIRPIVREQERIELAVLAQRADALQNADPAYRAELRAWTSGELEREDGVPSAAVPHTGPASYDDIPIRDFDTNGAGELPAATYSSLNQCLLLLSTVGDGPEQWLRAGEALQRVLLEITRLDYVAGIFTQIAEVSSVRAMLRERLELAGSPHVLLRVGRAPVTPATRRRRLVDVLVEQF